MYGRYFDTRNPIHLAWQIQFHGYSGMEDFLYVVSRLQYEYLHEFYKVWHTPLQCITHCSLLLTSRLVDDVEYTTCRLEADRLSFSWQKAEHTLLFKKVWASKRDTDTELVSEPWEWQHKNIVLHCIVLYCIVLYCIVLYCIVLYCIVLYCIVLYCIVLYCIVLYCIVLYCIVLYCIVLYCIVLYCIVLYCIVLYEWKLGLQ